MGCYHAFSFSVLQYIIPAYLSLIPFALRKGVRMTVSVRDLAITAGVSVLVLVPFAAFLSVMGKTFVLPQPRIVLFQLLAIALPEEIYFRGFLQQSMGNTTASVLIVSVLFAGMHLPQLFAYGDLFAVLTFFPSLVMGLLYRVTTNVLPPVVFHLFSNVVFLSVV